ncbi:MAG TPA: hypothetical protein VIJ75_21205 [Hanamia sp.]
MANEYKRSEKNVRSDFEKQKKAVTVNGQIIKVSALFEKHFTNLNGGCKIEKARICLALLPVPCESINKNTAADFNDDASFVSHHYILHLSSLRVPFVIFLS